MLHTGETISAPEGEINLQNGSFAPEESTYFVKVIP